MINKVILVGNLGKDPEISEHGEHKLIKFPLATSKSWKDKNGEWVEETTWHNCEQWRKNTPKGLIKGTKVYCEGEISNREYEGKWYTSIKLSVLRNLSPKTTTQPSPPTSPPPSKIMEDDDLPF